MYAAMQLQSLGDKKLRDGKVMLNLAARVDYVAVRGWIHEIEELFVVLPEDITTNGLE